MRLRVFAQQRLWMKTPKIVVFDIGNVLLEWRPERLYARLIPGVAARAAFFEETRIADMNLEVDRGAPFKEHIYAHAAKHPKYEGLIRAWHDNWIEMASPAIDGTVQILRALRKRGVRTAALSNFGVESFDYACTHYPFLTEFDVPVISGREETIKPEPRIYEILEERTGLLGQDIFFMDDSPKNVAAARARFWQAEIFTAPQLLGRQLQTRGLIGAQDVPD
jgi:2-haloacid dehalogenase